MERVSQGLEVLTTVSLPRAVAPRGDEANGPEHGASRRQQRHNAKQGDDDVANPLAQVVTKIAGVRSVPVSKLLGLARSYGVSHSTISRLA